VGARPKPAFRRVVNSGVAMTRPVAVSTMATESLLVFAT
jgi:hypothetical protein